MNRGLKKNDSKRFPNIVYILLFIGFDSCRKDNNSTMLLNKRNLYKYDIILEAEFTPIFHYLNFFFSALGLLTQRITNKCLGLPEYLCLAYHT